MFDPTLSLLNFVIFLRSTIIGTNRAIYRTYINEIKNSETMKVIFRIGLAQYLNLGYKALIYSCNGQFKREQDKDEFWIQKFDQFIHPEQSYVCALHKILSVLEMIYSSIDHSKLDISTIDNFTNTLDSQLDVIFNLKSDAIFNIQNHFKNPCNGCKIVDCDPKIDLFYFKN